MKLRDEGLIFERSRPGKTGYSLPPLDVPEKIAIPEELRRGEGHEALRMVRSWPASERSQLPEVERTT